MQAAGQWLKVLIIIYLLTGLGLAARQAQAYAPPPAPAPQQPATLAWTGPLACPSSGCAGGQTMSLRFFFAPTALDAALTPNVMICLFAPNNWIEAATTAGASISATGINTGQAYTKAADNAVCTGLANRPAGMTAIIQASAALPAETNSDAVELAFRLAPHASGINGVTAMLLVQAPAGTWTAQQTASSSTLQAYDPGVAGLSLAYVANDAAACGFYQPCYINSGVDLPNGLGTGLKDAVDILQPSAAAPSTINLLSSYTVKGSTVQINKAVTITALGAATLTYNDLKNCALPMLSLEDAVTLRGLAINDGGCVGPHRNLIKVASPKPVLIQSTTLTGGNDAIVIDDAATSGPVTVRFNQITANVGKAVNYLGDGTRGGALYVAANNLTSVQCATGGSGATAAPRIANHNYWANGVPDAAGTRCTLDPAKRLGLPIAPPAIGPGVNAVTALVRGDAASPASVMGGQVQFYHHPNEADFPLYVVDHGFLTGGGAPFSAGQSFDAPMPCSNYWDVFVDESSLSAPLTGTLELLLHYGRGSQDQCITTINSSKYCDQTANPALYPLYWFDPSAAAGTGWQHTGASGGQPTSCDMGRQLIQVSIDNDGKPGLSTQLGYTPLMIGLPVLNYFRAAASNNQVAITWATNVEPNISGFYLLRGTDPDHLSPISGRIEPKGSLNGGAFYPAIYDLNRANNVKYYYQLQIVRTDGSYFYSNMQGVTGTSATATITLTPTTAPPTVTRTLAPTSTTRPTNIPTRVPTLVTPFRSSTPTLARTLTPSPTLPVLDTLTPTLDPALPGAPETLTAVATLTLGAGTGTPIAALTSATPSPTLSLTPPLGAVATPGRGGSAWLSLFFGLLAGAAAVGGIGGAWYYLRLRR